MYSHREGIRDSFLQALSVMCMQYLNNFRYSKSSVLTLVDHKDVLCSAI